MNTLFCAERDLLLFFSFLCRCRHQRRQTTKLDGACSTVALSLSMCTPTKLRFPSFFFFNRFCRRPNSRYIREERMRAGASSKKKERRKGKNQSDSCTLFQTGTHGEATKTHALHFSRTSVVCRYLPCSAVGIYKYTCRLITSVGQKTPNK